MRTALASVSHRSVRSANSVPVRPLVNLFSTAAYADSGYGADGYVVLTTWNTSGTTWAGSMFIDNTSFGGWSLADQELDTAESSSPVFYWESGVDAGAQGGTAQPPAQRSWQGIPCEDTAAVATKINRNTWHSSWPWIVGAGVTCWLTGPGWPACTLPLATGILIATGLEQVQDWLTSCGCQYVSEACV